MHTVAQTSSPRLASPRLAGAYSIEPVCEQRLTEAYHVLATSRLCVAAPLKAAFTLVVKLIGRASQHTHILLVHLQGPAGPEATTAACTLFDSAGHL